MRFLLKISLLILLGSAISIPHLYSNDTLKYSINWLPPIPSWLSSDSGLNKSLLNFENVRHNLMGNPVFTQSFPENDNYCEVKLKLVSAIFDTIQISSALSGIDRIPEEISFSSNISLSEKRNMFRFPEFR